MDPKPWIPFLINNEVYYSKSDFDLEAKSCSFWVTNGSEIWVEDLDERGIIENMERFNQGQDVDVKENLKFIEEYISLQRNDVEYEVNFIKINSNILETSTNLADLQNEIQCDFYFQTIIDSIYFKWKFSCKQLNKRGTVQFSLMEKLITPLTETSLFLIEQRHFLVNLLHIKDKKINKLEKEAEKSRCHGNHNHDSSSSSKASQSQYISKQQTQVSQSQIRQNDADHIPEDNIDGNFDFENNDFIYDKFIEHFHLPMQIVNEIVDKSNVKNDNVENIDVDEKYNPVLYFFSNEESSNLFEESGSKFLEVRATVKNSNDKERERKNEEYLQHLAAEELKEKQQREMLQQEEHEKKLKELHTKRNIDVEKNSKVKKKKKKARL